MAKGKKTGGKDFETGHPKVGGRQKLPDWVRETKKVTAERFIEALHELCDLSLDEIEYMVKDKSMPVRTSIMANWLFAATSDDSNRQSLFNRLFGKVKDTVEVQMPVPTIIKRPNGEEVILGATMDKTKE